MVRFLNSLTALVAAGLEPPLVSKYIHQWSIVQYRMKENLEADPDIRQGWKLDNANSRLLRTTGVVGKHYCSNPGCDSTEEAALRCMSCRIQHYCSKECQKS
ncbi:hypothetical protein DL93DRAFT_2075367 [Clavulina sp. PMI_390]|nr:hypothetical protein DL93DRAFT_2075367 [Clavulina sp. PMI_390]